MTIGMITRPSLLHHSLVHHLSSIYVPSTVSATPGTSQRTKRRRDDEEGTTTVTDTEAPQDENVNASVNKKMCFITRVGPEVRRVVVFKGLENVGAVL